MPSLDFGPPARPRGFDAVVLAGGSAKRLGGADKPALQVGGVALLARVLAACSEAGRVVVVGPSRDLPTAVLQVREEPAGGGPVAALRAGLPHVTAEWVAVLAADLPFLSAGTLDRLLAAAGDSDGALLVDEGGRDQVLCGVWSSAALRAALQASSSARMRDVVGPLGAVRLGSAERPAPWFDCDTEQDLATARGRT